MGLLRTLAHRHYSYGTIKESQAHRHYNYGTITESKAYGQYSYGTIKAFEAHRHYSYGTIKAFEAPRHYSYGTIKESHALAGQALVTLVCLRHEATATLQDLDAVLLRTCTHVIVHKSEILCYYVYSRTAHFIIETGGTKHYPHNYPLI